MKKLVMGLLGAMMILSLAACTPTTEKNKTGEVKEPQQEEVVESTADAGPGVVTGRPVDQNASDLTMVSVYSVSKDGSKIEGTMDSVETLDAQSLVDLLIQYGVLDDGTLAAFVEHHSVVIIYTYHYDHIFSPFDPSCLFTPQPGRSFLFFHGIIRHFQFRKCLPISNMVSSDFCAHKSFSILQPFYSVLHYRHYDCRMRWGCITPL